MSFETLYEKYMNGTASEEERVYVEEEIAKARKLGEILEAAEKNEANRASPSGGADGENACLAPEDILEDADAEQVKKARKRHRIRSSVRALLISLVSAIVVAGAVTGGVIGTATGAAKKQTKISETQAKTIALEYYSANCASSEATGDAYIKNFEKDLEFTKKLKNSFYKYKLEVSRLGGYKIEIEIDSRTGAVTLVDWQ